MGKWAEVDCDCANRTPLPGSEFFHEPYGNKRWLTRREREEVEEWERTTKDMYACGHRNGVVIELGPDHIIHLGYLIGSIFKDLGNAFEVFVKVGDWRCNEDELLLIPPDEAALWLLEIEELQRAIQRLGDLPKNKVDKLIVEYYQDELSLRLDLKERLNRIVLLKQNLLQSPRPDLDSTIETIQEALADAAELCQASIRTGNAIRLLW
jgi:hypothetical protein